MKNLHIAALFDGITDTRRAHLRYYDLTDVLFLCICATLCGADAYTQIASFGEERLAWLQTFGSFANGIPSHDTVQRVLELLDTRKLDGLLGRWAQSLSILSEKSALAIDGKAVRGTWKKAGSPGLTLVSAWASDQRLCLGVEAVQLTGGEQLAAQTLLDLIAIKGKIITADANFLNKSFCEQIVAAKGDYVISLKANQPTLLAEAEAVFAQSTSPQPGVKNRFDETEIVERSKGRLECRKCVSTACLGFTDTPFATQWPGFRCFIQVSRQRSVRSGQGWKEERQVQYYISSLSSDATHFQALIRSHWRTENQQHYVLDVTFNEDRSTIRTGHGPKNMALLRRIALNLAQQHKPDKISLKGALFKAALSTDKLEKLLLGPKSDA